MPHNAFNTLKTFQLAAGGTGQLLLAAGARGGRCRQRVAPAGLDPRSCSNRVLRNCDGKKVTEEHVRQLADWEPTGARTDEIPFVLARIVLQDFTGVPLLADLAAMRSVAQGHGQEPEGRSSRWCPVDLVVDHSVQIDHYGAPNALDLNMKLEFTRNNERYQFMKWGMQAFDTFKVVPPGHRHRAPGEPRIPRARRASARTASTTRHARRHRQPHDDDQRHRRRRLGRGRHRGRGRHARPAGVLPHAGRGRREPEGQARAKASPRPTSCSPSPRCCARRRSSASSSSSSAKAPRRSSVPDRATIANMAPEYGATMGFFPVDDETIDYFARHRPHRRGSRRVRGLLQGAGPVRHPEERRDRLHEGARRSISRRSSRRSPARSARRTASSSASSKHVHELFSARAENGFARPQPSSARYSTRWQGAGTTQPPDDGSRQRATADLVEMVDNRPTPDRVPARTEASRSATATC